ncbi:MAG: PleD family two-component system response regulator [Terriglobales bacterium]
MSATPTVYFIDDSATMREVIKIAFRRENINVLACNDGASALAQMEQTRPDVVISDVIMPEKDGYEVCQQIKQDPRLSRTPVILMSGVVNRSVAERAFAVKADELIRKPFQPQDLINRVKHLLQPKAAAPMSAAAAANASAALSSIFSTPVTAPAFTARPTSAAAATSQATPAPPMARPAVPAPSAPLIISATPPSPAAAPTRAAAAPRSGNTPLEIQKMKIEILRLEGLVKKLQSELQAEREYARALEEHIKTLQEAE